MSLIFAAYILAVTVPALNEEARALFTVTDKRGSLVVEPELRDAFLGMPDSVQRFFTGAVKAGVLSDPSQVRDLLALQLAPAKLAYLLTDNCVLCHTNPSEQDPETLFSLNPKVHGSPAHLDLRAFVNDTHFQRGLSCSGCHGGSPTDLDMVDAIYDRWPKARARHAKRNWIPAFCARCHANPGFIRDYNPKLPTDQLAKYRTSRHGEKLLQAGDSKAAQCVSCHTAHSIYPANVPDSSVYPKNVPDTCGRCHADADYMKGYTISEGKPIPTDQVAKYKESVHGKALLLKNDIQAPVCNDCHGNHAAMPPKISNVAQVCRLCHQTQGELFDQSTHKKAFMKKGWPECEKCHGKHDIEKPTVAAVGSRPGNLCYECHHEYAKANTMCSFVATQFGQTLRWMTAQHEQYTARAEALAAKGLDVEPLEESLTALSDSLIQTQSGLHAFELSSFEKRAKPGIEAAKHAANQIAEAKAEFTFRRAGLTIAIVITLLFALALYLKLRQMEKRDSR